MPRKANQTIGTVTCPHEGEVAAVRKDASGLLYYVCAHSKVPMYKPQGQRWMQKHAIIWGPDGAPEGTPEWILLGRTGPPEQRETDPGNNAAPAPAESPDPGPPPVPRMITEPSPDLGSAHDRGTQEEKTRALPVRVPGTQDDDDPLAVLGLKF